MTDPLSAVDDAIPSLELVLEHARRYLEDARGPVRRRDADEAARSFAGALPDEGDGALSVIRGLLERGTRAHIRSGGPRFFHWVIGGSTPAALASGWVARRKDRTEGGCASSRM